MRPFPNLSSTDRSERDRQSLWLLAMKPRLYPTAHGLNHDLRVVSWRQIAKLSSLFTRQERELFQPHLALVIVEVWVIGQLGERFRLLIPWHVHLHAVTNAGHTRPVVNDFWLGRRRGLQVILELADGQ